MKFSSTTNPFVFNLLEELGCTLVFSTYQSGTLVLISTKEGKVRQLTRAFKKPMGIAINEDQMALATLDETILFHKNKELANKYPNDPKTYEALYMPRITYHTGILDLHDLSYGEENELFAVNTLFSCISKFSSKYSFEPYWKPSFISELEPEDRCHLNGMALKNGKPKYVTALSKRNTPFSWRENITKGGVLIDVETNNIILENLPMPHSPRIINNELFVLLSASGQIIKVDVEKHSYDVVAQAPGILRGMCEYGNYVFVGVSKPRESSKTFEKLPTSVKVQEAGVLVFFKPTWSQVGEIKYSDTISEIFDVQIIPNFQRGNILNTSGIYNQSIALRGKNFWKKTKNKLHK